jgi:hypothetical protein
VHVRVCAFVLTCVRVCVCACVLACVRVCAALKIVRYKYLVQVVMGEQKGEGIRVGTRTFWDSDTDKFASETFVNVRAFAWVVLQGLVVHGRAVGLAFSPALCRCEIGGFVQRHQPSPPPRLHLPPPPPTTTPTGPHLLCRHSVRRVPVLGGGAWSCIFVSLSLRAVFPTSLARWPGQGLLWLHHPSPRTCTVGVLDT